MTCCHGYRRTCPAGCHETYRAPAGFVERVLSLCDEHLRTVVDVRDSVPVERELVDA